MRYSTEPRFKNTLKDIDLWKFGNKYGKKLMNTATKTGIYAVKTASTQVVQNTAEGIGDLIGNRIADKVTSIGKSKEEKGKNRESRRNLHSTRKKTTNYLRP